MTSAATLIQNNLYLFYDRLAQTGGLDWEKNDHWSALYNEPGFWPEAIYRIKSNIIFENNSAGFAEKMGTGKYPGFLVAEDKDIEQISLFLQKHGFFPFAAWKGMILERFNEKPLAIPESVKVEKITGDADLGQWIQIVSKELINPALIEKSFLKNLLVHSAFELFLLKVSGEGVSTAMVFKTEDSCGLYLIATAKSAQQKGFGRILIHTLLTQLTAEAEKPVILQATPTGEILYRKLGFVPVNRFFLFRYLKNRL